MAREGGVVWDVWGLSVAGCTSFAGPRTGRGPARGCDGRGMHEVTSHEARPQPLKARHADNSCRRSRAPCESIARRLGSPRGPMRFAALLSLGAGPIFATLLSLCAVCQLTMGASPTGAGQSPPQGALLLYDTLCFCALTLCTHGAQVARTTGTAMHVQLLEAWQRLGMAGIGQCISAELVA